MFIWPMSLDQRSCNPPPNSLSVSLPDSENSDILWGGREQVVSVIRSIINHSEAEVSRQHQLLWWMMDVVFILALFVCAFVR